MKKLSIDIETYSTEDLLSSGVYRYSQSESFEILLLAYSEDGQPVKVIDLTKEIIPREILLALQDPKVIKTAWNALFERVCLSRHLGLELPADQWRCSMVHAAYLGLPMSLDYASKVLKVKEKDPAGKALIRHFCGPCKPTKTNKGRTRNTAETDPEKWAAFMQYCATDVDVETAISERLEIYEITDQERRLWILDQKINDTGIMLDMQLVVNAILLHEESQSPLTKQAQELTGLDNPGSVAQLKKWLSSQGVDLVSVTKSNIKEALQDSNLTDQVRDALHMRQEMAKTSVKKYQAMLNCVGKDDRARGLLQFYGASRTGRWAGRLVQVQNLPQNHLEALDTAREVVRSGDLGLLEMIFTSTSEVLSQLVRTAFVAPEGKVLISVDFSAIEARVIAWLAGEKWRLDVFSTHGKIYEASASQMFKIPMDKITKELRQKGKISELALGFGGGPNALLAMGALNMGLTEEELPGLVSKWRKANPKIVQLWDALETAAITAITEGFDQFKDISFICTRGILFVQLPSGRRLSYMGAKVEGGQMTYLGTDQTTKQWGKQRTYGGKLTENVVQAIARDLLAEKMLALDFAGHTIVMHVHDEVVLEGLPGDLTKALAIMRQPVDWAGGLPLNADGFEALYFQK